MYTLVVQVKKFPKGRQKVAKILTGKEISNLEKMVRGKTSVSFSTLSTLGTNSLLFSVEIIRHMMK